MDNCKSCGEVLFLTNNNNTFRLYEWLKERCKAELCRERLSIEQIRKKAPALIISYNYKYIIDDKIIDYMKGNIINLHISLLPWNRGSSPNIWSFIDHTPKGVTIHQINSGLDKGCIIYQKECMFDIQKETFASSYQKLNDTIIEVFQQNWTNIQSGNYVLSEQYGQGSYHNKKDLEELMRVCPFQWSDNIADYMEKYEDMKKKS